MAEAEPASAPSGMPRYITEQQWNPNGHTTRLFQTLQFFPDMLPLGFQTSFSFKCWEKDTSWLIMVTFHQVEGIVTNLDGAVTSEITIRRLDNEPINIATDFWMISRLPFRYHETCTKVLKADGLWPSYQAKKNITFMRKDCWRWLDTRQFQLEVFFKVSRCHADMGVAGSGGFAHQERYVPPPYQDEETMNVFYYSGRNGVKVQLPDACPHKSSE